MPTPKHRPSIYSAESYQSNSSQQPLLARQSNYNNHQHRFTTGPSHASLTHAEVVSIWQHASLLFSQLCWSESVIYLQRLLRRSRGTLGLSHQTRAKLWANLGILRLHLDEHCLALEAFEKAVEEEQQQQEGGVVAAENEQGKGKCEEEDTAHEEPELEEQDAVSTITTWTHIVHVASTNTRATLRHPFIPDKIPAPASAIPPTSPCIALYHLLAGTASFYLPSRSPTAYWQAQAHFSASLSRFPAGSKRLDLEPCGLRCMTRFGFGKPWMLERTRVAWNVNVARAEADFADGRGELIAGRHCGLNRMPAGIWFDAPDGKM